MAEPMSHLVHTDEAALEESSGCQGEDGSKEPCRQRSASSSAEERPVHTGEVVGSNPSSRTTPAQRAERILDLTGRKFGRLTVLSLAGIRNHSAAWLCECECGQRITTPRGSLQSGRSLSCGCLARERLSARRTSHGHTRGGGRTPEYGAWIAMKRRCYWPDDVRFSRYGGRGIEVCDAWLNDFEAFLAHIGPRPTPQHSVDRIDVDGNYCPGNVRWATTKEQGRNRANNLLVEIDGEMIPVSVAAERLGLNYKTLWKRVRRGFTPEEIVARPGDTAYRLDRPGPRLS